MNDPTPMQDVSAPKAAGLEKMKEALAGKTGRAYWRTLDEMSGTAEFERFLEDEFPNRSSLMQIDRRSLLKFMGASFALAGLSGCRSVFLPEDKLVPYVRQPEELVPGTPLYYATTFTLGGYATGILVEQHEGRPTKVEGNPSHPESLGSMHPFGQASVLSLYDPDRADSPTQYGDLSSWEGFFGAMTAALRGARDGAGIRIVTGAVTSPTFVGLMDRFLARYPGARWIAHEPCGQGNVHAGTALAFGRPLNPVYDFSKANVIVSLDGDFLNPAEFNGSLRYARDFANGRRVQGKTGTMSRLYVFESTPTVTGMTADHRWPVKASEIRAIAEAMQSGASTSGLPIDKIVRDVQANPGAAVFVAGPHQPPAVHALAHALNSASGAIGSTVRYTAPVEATAADRVGTLADLVKDLDAGAVSTVLILGANPVYSAPADLNFGEALKKAKLKVHHSMVMDETSALCDWHVPATHPMEEWGDARAYDGTASLVQPLMAPLFDGKSHTELLSTLLGAPRNGYDLVRAQWNGRPMPQAHILDGNSVAKDAEFEKLWRESVHDGVIKGSAFPAIVPVPTPAALPPAPVSNGIEVVFRPDPSIHDGRFANNGWLQELPKPVSKLTWDNAVVVSAKTAKALRADIDDDERISLEVNGRTVEGALFIQPGQPDDCVLVSLGYGRTAGGTLATVTGDDGGGFSGYSLMTSAGAIASGATLKTLGGQLSLATTQGHQPIQSDRIVDERDVVRETTLAEFLKNSDAARPGFAPDEEERKENAAQNLFPDDVFPVEGNQWGMTIDMNTCIGCNACVVACQAENNISVVGKRQVSRHREMHWLRIDRYYSGDSENPQATWQPIMCVHCEKAPCEPVCPVAATVHSHEGLNQMVYNRCVGTRYCSNNCPYKVRRFNYLNYSDNQPQFSEQTHTTLFGKEIPGPGNTPKRQGIELLRLVNNPDVTVRGRGVMEKCTYCVQRIDNARIEAKKAGRPIKDGEIVTACQQACPTQTIVFGNVADPKSAVSRLREDPRAYLLLEELQTRPRTSHLAKLRNPNPEIEVTA